MRVTPLLSILVLMTACAAPRSQSEVDEALDSHIRCTRSAIVALDDQRSDAMTIAAAADAACSREWARSLDVGLGHLGADARARSEREMRPIMLRQIAADVLQRRANRR